MSLGSQDVFANVVGGLKVVEPAADLAVALAVAVIDPGRFLDIEEDAEALDGHGPHLGELRDGDLALFYDISGRDRPASGEQIPMSIVVPAFMISELTTAFRMGLFLYIPLLLVDLLVSALLMSMGMMMVPPTLIALPVKVGLFVMADGWRLVVASLARSFG